jgi:hypothetical protein
MDQWGNFQGTWECADFSFSAAGTWKGTSWNRVVITYPIEDGNHYESVDVFDETSPRLPGDGLPSPEIVIPETDVTALSDTLLQIEHDYDPSREVVTYTLSGPQTIENLFSYAISALPDHPEHFGDPYPRWTGIWGLWGGSNNHLYPASNPNGSIVLAERLVQGDRDVRVSKGEYKVRVFPPAHSTKVQLLKVFTPQDNPTTVIDESASQEFEFKETDVSQGSEETTVVTLDPNNPASPNHGKLGRESVEFPLPIEISIARYAPIHTILGDVTPPNFEVSSSTSARVSGKWQGISSPCCTAPACSASLRACACAASSGSGTIRLKLVK